MTHSHPPSKELQTQNYSTWRKRVLSNEWLGLRNRRIYLQRKMVELIQALLSMVGLITLIYLFLMWGLSGQLKKFFSRKKDDKEMNDGGW